MKQFNTSEHPIRHLFGQAKACWFRCVINYYDIHLTNWEQVEKSFLQNEEGYRDGFGAPKREETRSCYSVEQNT